MEVILAGIVSAIVAVVVAWFGGKRAQKKESELEEKSRQLDTVNQIIKEKQDVKDMARDISSIDELRRDWSRK